MRPALGALVACALVVACGVGPPPPAAATRAALRTAPVELRDVALTVSAEAVVEAVRQSTVSAQVSGRIVDIRFDVGDRVRKGEVILRIDERGAAQAVAASEAQAREAEAGLVNARAQYERARQLLAQKFVSQAAVDKAEADFKAAESRMKAMLAGAGQAATERSFATILAPYSGVVSARHVQLGEMATPGRPLMTGFDPASLRVVATLSSMQAQLVTPATPARVEVPSANLWIDARGITLVPAADPRTLASQVRVDLPEDVRGDYPGIFARAHFVIGSAPRLMVPREAIVHRSEVTAVYVVDGNGRASMRQVRIGTASDERAVEVLSGVRVGESVALDPVAAGALRVASP
jgi:RND family efflux transporter MFP subunit